MKWFKLLLLNEDDIKKEEIRNSPELQQARILLAQSEGGLTSVQIVGFYLRKIWNHAYTTLKSMMDIDDLPLRVAITIPAIWPAYAQSAMRQAAEIAGITKHREIGETTLILVQEPEAAALASLFQHSSFPEIKVLYSVFALFARKDLKRLTRTTEERVIYSLRCWRWDGRKFLSRVSFPYICVPFCSWQSTLLMRASQS